MADADDARALQEANLQRAQEIIRGAHTGSEADERAYAGKQDELAELLGGGRGADSAEIREIDADIREITRLAHSANEKDQDEYQSRQGELRALIAQRAALVSRKQGTIVTAKPTPTVPKAGASKQEIEAFRRELGVPESPLDYPKLPDDGRPPEQIAQDGHLWMKALPKLHAAGITMQQAVVLGNILREAEADLQAYKADYREQVQYRSKRDLARRYGASYHAEVAKANRWLRQALPDGKSRELCGLQLADGGTLGDHELFVRTMIEFSREAL